MPDIRRKRRKLVPILSSSLFFFILTERFSHYFTFHTFLSSTHIVFLFTPAYLRDHSLLFKLSFIKFCHLLLLYFFESNEFISMFIKLHLRHFKFLKSQLLVQLEVSYSFFDTFSCLFVIF